MVGKKNSERKDPSRNANLKEASRKREQPDKRQWQATNATPFLQWVGTVGSQTIAETEETQGCGIIKD